MTPEDSNLDPMFEWMARRFYQDRDDYWRTGLRYPHFASEEDLEPDPFDTNDRHPER
jgi:hypothetical protein